jgi:hypothetical protein
MCVCLCLCAFQDHFPGKNQKAVQEKFYKSTKDPREPRWKKMYDDLRAQHDAATAAAKKIKKGSSAEACVDTQAESSADVSDEDDAAAHEAPPSQLQAGHPSLVEASSPDADSPEEKQQVEGGGGTEERTMGISRWTM